MPSTDPAARLSSRQSAEEVLFPWPSVPLGELFEIQQGKALNSKTNDSGGLKPFLRTANVLWGRVDITNIDKMPFTTDEMTRLYLLPGDLLICEGGDIGRTAIWRGELAECAYQNHVHRLRAKRSDVSPDFFAFWMQAAIQLLGLYGGEGNKTTIPNLSKGRLASFLVPLPPKDEQRRVAQVLIAIQRAILKQDNLTSAIGQVKQSLMRHLFTYGPIPEIAAAPARVKHTDFGPVPQHWREIPIGELFHVQLGKMLSPKSQAGSSPAPYLRNANVQWGRCNVRNLKTMDFDQREREKFALSPGDLLVCEGGEVGRTAIWRGEIANCYFQKALHRLRPKTNQISAVYFMYWMMELFLFRQYSFSDGTKTTIAHLPAVKLKAMSLPLPPKPEQDEIVKILAAIDKKLDVEQQRLTVLRKLFDAALHHLMTGKIRVPESLEA